MWAYEAAVGLDPSLPVVEGVGTPTGLPLVWFGLSREPDSVPPIEPAPGRFRDYAVGRWNPGWTPEAEHAELLAKAVILNEPYEEFALIETMAHVPPAGLRHLDRHLQRMADSANYFGFRFDAVHARDRLLDVVAGHGPARVRVLLSRDGALHVELGTIPLTSSAPLRLAVDVDPVDSTQRWLRHKTTRREVYTARATRHPHADDVILTNERGQVTETTIANIVA